jgi:hypothetical protein
MAVWLENKLRKTITANAKRMREGVTHCNVAKCNYKEKVKSYLFPPSFSSLA